MLDEQFFKPFHLFAVEIAAKVGQIFRIAAFLPYEKYSVYNNSVGNGNKNARLLVRLNILFYLCIAGMNTDFSDARRAFLPEEAWDLLPETSRDFVGTDVPESNRATVSGRPICLKMFIRHPLFQSCSGFPR